MTLANRVTPDGRIVAVAERGTFMGNRGCLHDAERHLRPAPWQTRRWIICVLDFKGRKRPVMAPGRYTELFFLDEAVALAAGHRPCAECRRAAYRAYCAAWAKATGEPDRADAIDLALHAARVDPVSRQQVVFRAPTRDLPDGTFLRPVPGSEPHLLWRGILWRYTPGGYHAAGPAAGASEATVLTPRPNVAALRAGYVPQVHASVIQATS